MRTTLFAVCASVLLFLGAPATAPAANDGINESAQFFPVDIHIVVAKRSAIETDEGTRALHLKGLAQAQRSNNGDMDTLDIDDDSGNEAIDLEATKGQEETTPDAFLVIGDLMETKKSIFEGMGVLTFDIDDEEGPSEGDQSVPVRVKVVHRSNAKTDFIQGTLHNVTSGVPGQPQVNGRIRGTEGTPPQ